MNNDVERAQETGISRRTVAKAVAWSVPAIAVAATVPIAAASLRKDPGINGWVLVNTDPDFWSCGAELTFNSAPRNGGRTPDGAPFGLYVYDVEDPNVFSDAKMIIWVIGDRSAGEINWSTRSGHSSSWSGPTRIGTQVKHDGQTYTGYQWTYTGPILASDRGITDPDGVERLKLRNFHVRAHVDGVRAGGYRCNVTYWIERMITIDPDGNGPLPAEVHKFQRRGGTMGDASGYGSLRSRRSAVEPGEQEGGPLPASAVV
ncbi:hypothetical protein PTQ19_03405 [Microbacterium esteraromaticum]|uniref:hypothetical protein n=1 Tax=Microbacterium esteraromaticum TaxID=57043 RepID=UPI0023679277|nr:hypothetical protein [Microbacterium esteraromaticum]WDH79502.1 hypothetical protein PTQ19_03405 [Microbacterium esteraromaticum]